jgi:hypothetical protein
MQGRGKEIILLVLALCALGLALYMFRGKPAPAPTPSGPATPAPATEAAGQEVAAATEEGAATEGGAEAASAGGVRNPFSTPGAAPGPEPTETAGASTPTPVEPPPGVTERPPVETGLTLEGIVTGPPTVAVIRHGGKPYFVKVGESVADLYRVEAIRGGREVVLAGQQGTVVLRTGKSS